MNRSRTHHNKSYLAKPLRPLAVGKKSVATLLDEMALTGFQGKKLGQAAALWLKMLKDKDLMILMGYTGSLSTTGQWQLVRWLMANRCIDILVSTGANISEDIVEAMGFHYYQGSHLADDGQLFRSGVNRYYDVYGREDDYLKMTELIAEFIMTLDESRQYSSREFLHMFGKWLGRRGVSSIVTAAARHGVPIFCPAIADSPYGDAALIAQSKGFHLTIDAVKDYIEFMGLAEHTRDTGVIYIGGGVPKDFIQLFSVTGGLLYKDHRVPNRRGLMKRQGTNESYYPHKYAIQITTDSPQWGGLSGCTLEEAISWGKIAQTENHLTCYCDATIALPLITQALHEKMRGTKRKGFNFVKQRWSGDSGNRQTRINRPDWPAGKI